MVPQHHSQGRARLGQSADREGGSNPSLVFLFDAFRLMHFLASTFQSRSVVKALLEFIIPPPPPRSPPTINVQNPPTWELPFYILTFECSIEGSAASVTDDTIVRVCVGGGLQGHTRCG